MSIDIVLEQPTTKRNTTPKVLQSPLLLDFVSKFTKETTKREIRQRLITFEEFIKESYKTLVDREFIKKLVTKLDEEAEQDNKIFIYDMFSDYVEYLKGKNLSRDRIQYLLVYSKRAINKYYNKYFDKKIDDDTFNDYVRPSLPDSEREDKTLITNDDIKRLIYACGNDLKLRTLITVLGSTGARIGEILKVKHKYLKLEWTKENGIDIPPYIYIPAFITKTRRERKAYLTTEAVEAIKDWINYKYRPRKIVKLVNSKYESIDYVKPTNIDESYVFKVMEDIPTTDKEIKEMEENMKTKYTNIYRHIYISFRELLEKEGIGKKFRNKRNNSVSIHSLRWYVVNTVESLTNLTNAYFWVGKRQKGYIFPDKDLQEILKLYRKVELDLTFINPKIVKETERKEIQSLREEMKQQKKEILLMKFDKVLQNIIAEKRNKDNYYSQGIRLTPQQQYEEFIQLRHNHFSNEDLELIKQMIDNGEIEEYVEESPAKEELIEKFHDRWNEYSRLGKIDFNESIVSNQRFDENDNLIIEFKKNLNRENLVLPPLNK
jgi:integrase